MLLKKSLRLAAAVCALGAAPAWAGDKVLYGPVPDWVKPVAAAPEAGDSEAASLPVRILLVDTQQRLEGTRSEKYTAFELKFQTPQGLQAGNIALPWRQDSDDLTVHKVVIHRGDQTIDVLKEGQTFTVLRREQNLEQSTLDGVLTANMFPEGLQVGDVLEVAATIVSSDPVLAGHGEAAFGPLTGPIGRAHMRLSWPAADKVQLHESPDMPAWKRSREGGFEIAELTLDNPKPVAVPDDAPLRYHLVRFAEASDFSSWAEVAGLFAPLFKTAANIPADGPLRAEVERIKAASPDPVKRAEAALDLVESRIRYVALELGQGGLVPATATETWSRRFGDCKAKTALLLGVLGELGIDAEPVLVNATAGDMVAVRLPGASAFNHVIVRAHIGGKDYWLDGTRTGDTSLARLQVPYFSWGLPVVPGAQLVRMVPPPLSQPSEDIAIRMDASKGVHAPVPTTVELTLRGDAALATNQMMANVIGDARERGLREYWRNRFSFIEPQKVGMIFDEASGELHLTMEGTAKLDWGGQWYQTDETRVGSDENFIREATVAKDAPHKLAYPEFTRTRETIVVPSTFALVPDSDWNVDETVAGVEYKRHVTLGSNTFTIERTQRVVLPEIAVQQAIDAQPRLKALYDNVAYLRLPPDYRPTEADLAIDLTHPAEKAVDLIAQGMELDQIGKTDEAVARYTRATQADPHNAEAWARLALLAIDKGDFDKAGDLLDKAAAIDSHEQVTSFARGILAQHRYDWKGAADAFTAALANDRDNKFVRQDRAEARMRLQQWDLALADIDELLKEDPKQAEVYGMRGIVLSRAGRAAEAEAAFTKARQMAADADTLNLLCYDKATMGVALDRALEECNAALRLKPDIPYILDSRGTVLLQMGKLDPAIADFDKALAKTPTLAATHYARAVAWARKGDLAKAKVDEQAALKLDAGIAVRFAGYGLTLQPQKKPAVSQTASAR